MTYPRRQILKTAALGAAAAAQSAIVPGALGKAFRQGETTPLRILLLGGTGFIGPHMVREALRRGHEVTLFNRMRTNSGLFPDLVTLKGDRDNGLDALEGKRWDVVIDNSGYVPRHVADSARLLSKAAAHYIYVSTVSVYASLAEPVDEDSALATLDDTSVEEVTGDTYGPLKALCEQRAAAEFGADRLTVLRPTYICGPGDHTDRYTYWPVRTQRGGKMLWPGTPSDPIQIIDVRDLARFTLDVAGTHTVGTYNTVTPAGQFTMGDLLTDCRELTAEPLSPVWVSAEFLAANSGEDELPLPIWHSPDGEYAGVALVSGEKAVAAGLRNRPTRETARDTLDWWHTLPEERQRALKRGLAPDREASLLDAWRASAGSAPAQA